MASIYGPLHLRKREDRLEDENEREGFSCGFRNALIPGEKPAGDLRETEARPRGSRCALRRPVISSCRLTAPRHGHQSCRGARRLCAPQRLGAPVSPGPRVTCRLRSQPDSGSHLIYTSFSASLSQEGVFPQVRARQPACARTSAPYK